MVQSNDIAIVGAGIVGIACAHKLAPDHNVTVIDKGAVAGDTTSRASGVINSHAVYADEPEIGKHTMDFFREFDGTGTFTFTRQPKLQLIQPDGEDDAREEAKRDIAKFVEKDDIENQYPGIFNDLSPYCGILVYQDAGLINPSDYAHSLKHSAEKRGASFYTDTKVTAINTSGGEVTGVETEYENFKASTVVCATNWRTRELLSELVEIPVRPFRWNAVILKPEHGLDMSYPAGSESNKELYWRPTPNGNLLFGGGEHIVDDPDGTPMQITDEFRQMATKEAQKLLKAAENARIVREECCPSADAASPDTWPIIDAPDDAPDGLIVATGTQRGGIMTSPAMATAVRSLITGEECRLPMERFVLDRFESRSADFGYVSPYESIK